MDSLDFKISVKQTLLSDRTEIMYRFTGINYQISVDKVSLFVFEREYN